MVGSGVCGGVNRFGLLAEYCNFSLKNFLAILFFVIMKTVSID